MRPISFSLNPQITTGNKILDDSIEKPRIRSFKKGDMLASFAYGKFSYTGSYFIYQRVRLLEHEFDTAISGVELSPLGNFHGKFEYAVANRLGLGLNVDYFSQEIKWTENAVSQATGLDTIYYSSDKGYTLNISARMNVHIITRKKVDFFLGMQAGFNAGKYKYTSSNPSPNDDIKVDYQIPAGRFVFGMTLGFRFYVKPQMAIFTEIGYATSIFQIGGSYKF